MRELPTFKWAIFRDGKRLTKWHSTRHAAVIEAFERGFVVTWRSGRNVALAAGLEIRQEIVRHEHV